MITWLLAVMLMAAPVTPTMHAHAQRVTIERDTWGIAHVSGKTDDDAVFGMTYAQAEDNFNRIEMNYLTALGRTAEAEGENNLAQDLRARLWVDPADLQQRYHRSPAWLRSLMNAWADGLNYYLATHPAVHPRVLTHFEPWMALSFSEGSIGGDVERVPLEKLAAFYSVPYPAPQVARATNVVVDPQGSNGIAIAPKNTANHRALLLINPHTSFYFRSVVQMRSHEGLNAYGAVTWGQFFVYQGFNEHIGWMHTSTGADNVDAFAETVVQQNGAPFYRYGAQLRPIETSSVTLRYRAQDGTLQNRTFTIYRTHHGPIVRSENGKWVAQALMFRPVAALEESYLRTKAHDFASFRRIAQLQANSSNNTIFADDRGEIAYMHAEFMPRRSDRFDYTKPVDGSDPATDWHGLHRLDELPNVTNPPTGWVFNTNNWPYSAAGANSPKQNAYPAYMDTAGENARGVHATMLLQKRHDFTIERLRAAAYDPYLPFFASLVPSLTSDGLAQSDPLRAKIAAPAQALEQWDARWSSDSVATSIAIYWAEALAHIAGSSKLADLLATTPKQKIQALSQAVDRLTADFGTWQTAWGNVNRFQRLTSDIHQRYDDTAPSIPVPFVAGTWGSLAAFYAKPAPNTKRRYGESGNSFVAVVEFGKRVRAIAVTAGGESGRPQSKHFTDQATAYASGALQPVYFYPDELRGHIERTYHP